MEPTHNKEGYKDRDRDLGSINKIDRILIDIQKKLKETYSPISMDNLSAFERKKIHSFFDNKPDFETKTYRNGDDYVLKIYPVGKLRKFASEKAQQVLETGTSFFWKELGNYERFIVHDHLKTYEGIETVSSGDGGDRILEIKPKQFGRALKKIMKKIKLF